jgi:MoaA/NifB/PqqE/SkfB family radical SAM enzyme
VPQGLKEAALIHSGYGCNSACRFCDQVALRRDEGDRSSEEVTASIEAMDLDGKTAVFAGGEITLRRELSNWIEHARRRGAERIVIQTNGRMLAYPKLVKRLSRAGADIFAVALHGHTAELHDWLTRSEGSFAQTIKGLENLRASGAVILVNCVMTRSNYRHMPQIVQLAGRLGAAAVRFIWPRPEGDAVAEWPMLEPEPSMVRRYADLATGVGEKLRVRVSFDGSGDAPYTENTDAR